MFYLTLLVLMIPSPVLLILNAEAAAILIGLVGARSLPLTVASIVAGQLIFYTVAYYFGDKLILRIPWVRKKVDKFDFEKAKTKTDTTFVLAGFLGLPPLNVTAALGPMLGISLKRMLSIIAVTRIIRFTIVISVPAYFSEYFDPDVLPSWFVEILT